MVAGRLQTMLLHTTRLEIRLLWKMFKLNVETAVDTCFQDLQVRFKRKCRFKRMCFVCP
jgi:hypothetical protein